MSHDFANIIDDIRAELRIASRSYPVRVITASYEDNGIWRVAFKSSRSLNQVRDQLEGGHIVDEDDPWCVDNQIVHVANDQEGDVIFVVNATGISFQAGEPIRLRLFNYIKPLVEVFEVAEGHRPWQQRMERVLDVVAMGTTSQATRGRQPTFDDKLDRAWNADIGCVWGPPGTGKTYTLGRQVAKVAGRGRTLVVSTTNKATDGAALEIARALTEDVAIKRVGSGARPATFTDPEVRGGPFPNVIPEDPPELLEAIEEIHLCLQGNVPDSERASLKARLRALRKELKDHPTRCLLDSDCSIVVTTAFTAIDRLSKSKVGGQVQIAPLFETLCVDEAGLISAPVVAALSVMARNRVVLFGDPRQLAPIAKKSAWLRRSSAARIARPDSPSTCFLASQRRMDPPIRDVVSGFTYNGALAVDEGLEERVLPALPSGLRPGHLSVVFLDDVQLEGRHRIPEASLGADRGPHGRSYIRYGTRDMVLSMMRRLPELADAPGLFLSPFAAQARFMRGQLAEVAPRFESSTVHAQQGREAPVVVFDTVDLTKARGWSAVDPDAQISEWQRLLNVGISRGQNLVLLVTTRAEWYQDLPHINQLRAAIDESMYTVGTWAWSHDAGKLVPVAPGRTGGAPRTKRPRRPATLGARIEAVAGARPVLTMHQLEIAGDPRLDGAYVVRGVPGSGKTLVMAEWAVRTKVANQRLRVGIVYFTIALGAEIRREVHAACERLGEASLADEIQVQSFHHDILGKRRRSTADWQGEKEAASRLRLARPQFDILFVDEGQDFGIHGAQYLLALVDPPHGRARNARVFLDAMQATGSTEHPDWADMLALAPDDPRILVLRESFRSTRQIVDLAVNLYAFMGGDLAGLAVDRLVHRVDTLDVAGEQIPLWTSDFALAEGPPIEVRRFAPERKSRNAELRWVADRIRDLVMQEDVLASEIAVVMNNFVMTPFGPRGKYQDTVRRFLHDKVEGVAFGRGSTEDPDDVEVYTLEQVTGLEFEVVIVVGVDTLMPHPKAVRSSRAHHLYTAVTRARQLVILTGTEFPSAECDETGLNVLDVAEALAQHLASIDYDDARHEVGL